MNKFYLILLFIGFAFSAAAQEQKSLGESHDLNASKEKIIRFFPNPATTVINFEFIKPVSQDLLLQVYNFIGKKVYETPTTTQKTTIPLNEFFRGMYIFQLKDKSGRIIESGKFQVSK